MRCDDVGLIDLA